MSTSDRVFVKDPDAVLDYGIDWSDWLESSETISTSTWLIDSGITKDSDSFSDTATLVWLSGGTAGATYRLTNRITTSAGRTEDRSIWIKVKEK